MTWTRSVSTHQFVKMKYIFLFLITVRREKLWGLTLTFLSWHLHSLCKTFLERSWPTWHCCQDYSTVLGRLQGCLASSSGATKAIFSSKLQGRAELFYGQNTYRCKTELQPRDQRPMSETTAATFLFLFSNSRDRHQTEGWGPGRTLCNRQDPGRRASTPIYHTKV